MISVIVRGTYRRDSEKDKVKIGKHKIICGRADMRYLNSLEVGDEITCLCSMESGELYYRFAYKGADSILFIASGILDYVTISKDPGYLLVRLIREDVAPEGDRFNVTTEKIYVENNKQQLKMLRKIRYGDVIAATGIVVINDKDQYFCVAKEIKTVNSFVVLSGLEHQLPFDDKRKELEELEEIEGLEVKKGDF